MFFEVISTFLPFTTSVPGPVKTNFNFSEGVTVEYVDPANLIYSYTEDPNFEDIYYVGELSIWMRLVLHIPFIPIVAGIGYEVLKLTAKYQKNIFFLILAKPGLWLQNITTKQPDDMQVEVALKALESAFGDNLD